MPDITFRYISVQNNSSGADIYPTIRSADGKAVVWDGRANEGTYWLIMEGQDKTVDPVNDLNSNGFQIYPNNIQKGQQYRIGCNVVWGNDDWYMGDTIFTFDPTSSVKIRLSKKGGLRDGDLVYDGIQN